LFILRGTLGGFGVEAKPIFSQLMFRAVLWAARRGLREEGNFSRDLKKQEARLSGVRGKTYAYWYLRKQGYIFVARNYTPRGIKGEIDLVGYDGKTLAFVEVRTRTIREDLPALPELVLPGKNNTWWFARRSDFWRNGTSASVPCWFDVMAIDNLHRAATVGAVAQGCLQSSSVRSLAGRSSR